MSSSGWLSTPIQANILKPTYVNGFLDMSGNLTVRGGGLAMDGQIVQNTTPGSYNFGTYTAAADLNSTYLNISSRTPVITGTLKVTSDVSINGIFTANSDSSLNGNLFVSSDTSFNGKLSIGADVSMNGKLTINKDISCGGNIIGNMLSHTKFTIDGSTNGFSIDVSGAVRFLNTSTFSKILVLYDNATGDSTATGTNFYGFGVSGGGNFLRYQTPAAGNTHNFYAGTSFASLNANSYNIASDYRLKEDIIDFKHVSSQYPLNNLRPVFYINKNTRKNDIGFLAHELAETFPFLVYGEKDGEYHQTINYSGLIGLLVHEIQTLKERVSELEKKLP
jgi:hypothetical protein